MRWQWTAVAALVVVRWWCGGACQLRRGWGVHGVELGVLASAGAGLRWARARAAAPKWWRGCRGEAKLTERGRRPHGQGENAHGSPHLFEVVSSGAGCVASLAGPNCLQSPAKKLRIEALPSVRLLSTGGIRLLHRSPHLPTAAELRELPSYYHTLAPARTIPTILGVSATREGANRKGFVLVSGLGDNRG